MKPKLLTFWDSFELNQYMSKQMYLDALSEDKFFPRMHQQDFRHKTFELQSPATPQPDDPFIQGMMIKYQSKDEESKKLREAKKKAEEE